MPKMIIRIARSLLRPALRFIKRRILRIRSTPARGFVGLAGQWSLPGRPDQEEAFLRRLNYTGKTVYDLGANVGATTLFFSAQVTVKGTVIAFEPNPEVLDLLKRHVELNRCDNVKLFSYAIGNEKRRSTLRVPCGGRGAGTLKSTIYEAEKAYSPNADLFGGATTIDEAIESDHEVLQTTLDQLIKDEDLAAPDFVKVDTEGFETEVLLGMQDTLEEHHPTLFLEIHGYSNEEKLKNADDIVQILSRHQYDLLHVETDTPLQLDNSEVAKQGHIFATVDPKELLNVSH